MKTTKKVVAKKVVAGKKSSKKTTAKKVETKSGKKSISRIVFDFINSEKLLDIDNRKAKYDELEALVKAEFPESKFQKTHFYWYLTRASKQRANGLDMTHLVTIPVATEK